MRTERRPIARLGKPGRRGHGALLIVTAAGLIRCAEAQEALRVSLAGEQAARSRRIARQRQPDSFKMGDAEVRLGGRLGTEWNDNITLVEQNTVSDTIFRPQVNADLAWPITTANFLEATVAAGYSAYVSHPEYDRPFILPVSALAFDLFVRDVKLTLEDRVSYQQDPAERAVVTGTANFGGIENLAGVEALADWNDARLSFAYHHLLFVSTVSEYEYLDRTSHQFFTRFTLQPRSDAQVGLEAGLTPTTYFDSYLRDNLSYSGGGFAEWTVSPHISVNGRGGGVFYELEPGSGTQGAQDVPSFYFSLGVAHRLRRSLSVSLECGQESQLGVNDDLTEQFYLRHTVNWRVSRKFSAMGSLVYENGTEFGVAQFDSFSRLSLGLSASWQWSRHWSARLNWRFISRDSDRPLRGYDNHRVSLEIDYRR